VDELLKAYPNDLRFVYKQFPLTQIHQNALPAAKAAAAAQKQGKFWEMHDELFEIYNQLTPENIRKKAEEIGLDLAKFDADVSSPDVMKLIQQDMTIAQQVGVSGTPTMFINGKRVMNRTPEGMKAMIDEELKKKGGGEKKS
jgi:protein-disulfide isomerase